MRVLKKCKWCGKLFEKQHNREEYCCDDCRRYARMEQKAEWIRNYRKEYSQVECIGSGGLGKHRRKVFLEEHIAVCNEMKRLDFKPLFQY